MGDTITINNFALDRIKRVLLSYHNMFMSEIRDPITKELYIFSEMSKIGENNKSSVPTSWSSTAKSYNIQTFNSFIDAIVNFNLSNKVENYNQLLKIKSSNTQTTFNDGVIVNIYSCMNIVNVFIDILEAYKDFIDTNTNFKELLNDIVGIHIVEKYSKIRATTSSIIDQGFIDKNVGYVKTFEEGKILFLSINSFSYTDANTNNHIFTPYSTNNDIAAYNTNDIASYGLFANADTTNGVFHTGRTKINYKKQTVSKNSGVIKMNTDDQNYDYINNTTLFTLENRDKNILKNFLYFLMRINPDNARIQVYALYYYYKIIKLYILLTLATYNIIIYNISSASDSNLKYLKLLEIVIINNTGNAIFTNITKITNVDTLNSVPSQENINKNTYIKTLYSNVLSHIQSELNLLISNLYNNTNYASIQKLDTLYNKSYIAKTITLLTNQNNSPTEDVVELKHDDTTTINENELNYIIKHYNILLKMKSYNIIGYKNHVGTDNANGNFVIKATTDIENIELPYINGSDTDIVFKLVKKGLLDLKQDYNNNKYKLEDINANISMNISKINNQKNMYNYQYSRDTLLTNQLYAYYVIIGAIFLAIIGMNIIKIEKPLKILISMVFTGIIVLLFIIYYIIGSAYIEEFKNIEKFYALKNITTTTSLQEKKIILSDNIEGINSRFIELLSKLMSVIALQEPLDFYNELNDVMINEKSDKENIVDILSFKRSLGNSNIDILKYEINNKKINITVLLFSSLIAIGLYIANLYFSEKYTNLIVFIGIIFFIIIFSYYIIFTSKTVRNRSSNKYWGPENNKRL